MYKDNKKIIILGHLNCRNKGDEAILISILTGLESKFLGATVYVLTEDYWYDKQFVLNFGIKLKIKLIDIHNRFFLINKLLQIFKFKKTHDCVSKHMLINSVKKQIKKADIVLISARDLFAECYGQESFVKYMEYFELAVSFNKNVYIWGGSFGPFNELNESRFKAALAKTKFITCRESKSFSYVSSLTNNQKCTLVPDPAFMLKPTKPTEYILKSKIKKRLAVSISDGIVQYKNLNKEKYLKIFSEAICNIAEKYNLEIILIPHVCVSPEHNDFITSAYIQKICAKNAVICELPPADLKSSEYKYIINNCDFLIGTRTHTTIASLSLGIPTIAIAYSRKAYGIFQDFYGHTKYVLDVKEMDSRSLENKFKDLFDNEKYLREVLQEKAKNIYTKTVEAWQLIN